MALLHVDGFDHYATNGTHLSTELTRGVYVNTLPGTSFSIIDTPYGRGLTVSSYAPNYYFSWNLPAPKISGKLGVGFHFKWVGGSTTARNPQILRAVPTADEYNDTVNLHLAAESTGALSLRVGNTVIASTSVPFDTWCHIETVFTLGVGTATVVVRIDGVEEINESGLTIADINRIDIVSGAGSNNVQVIRQYDNLYVWDETGPDNNDWLGPLIVDTLLPTSDDTAADWAPATGSDGYAMLDNVPVNPVQYVEGDTVGDISKYGVTYAPAFDATVKGVAVYMKAMRTGVADEDVLFGIDAGTVDGEITVPSEEFSYREHIVELNPDTGVAWTLSDIANSKLHIERLS